MIALDFALGPATDLRAFVARNLPDGAFRRVVLKPNWVKHQERPEFPIAALVTSAALIDAALEACLVKESKRIGFSSNTNPPLLSLPDTAHPMLEHQNALTVGSPRTKAACGRTVEVITGKLRELGTLVGQRMLDVGCGDGGITAVLGERFREVHGIDVQDSHLESFRAAVQGDPKFTITHMSAAAMIYNDAHFDAIVTIETLEHVADLAATAREIARVLRPGGELLITVPNRWFPFENHGVRIGSWERGGRIPLLPYLPWLHRRISLARVFKARDLDALFVPHGLKRAGISYAWPTFEHGGNRLQPLLKPLFGVMRAMERGPLRFFGSSVVVRYVKR